MKKNKKVFLGVIGMFLFCCFCPMVLNFIVPSEIELPESTSTQAYTKTNVPTNTKQVIQTPTATVFIFKIQTEVEKMMTVTVTPEKNSKEVCSCSTNSLNCSDFKSHKESQSCFNYCKEKGLGDVHELDGNPKNGLACENLP